MLPFEIENIPNWATEKTKGAQMTAPCTLFDGGSFGEFTKIRDANRRRCRVGSLLINMPDFHAGWAPELGVGKMNECGSRLAAAMCSELHTDRRSVCSAHAVKKVTIKCIL